MARAQFNAREHDQNFQIEDGIRETLINNPTASVDVSVVESCYDVLDAEGSEVSTATLNEKCQQIANVLGLVYSIRESLVIFRTKRSAS